jgi:hypothetical protein
MNKYFYNFEKIEERWLFYFNFFNRNVQSKHVCQLAYNGFGLGEVATCTKLIINREVSVAILPNCC